MTRQTGDKAGPRIAQLVAQYVLAARRDLGPHEARVRQVATQALIDKAGHEFADHIGPILRDAIASNPDMDSRVKDYLTRTASGQHQLQAVAGHLAMAGAGSVLSTLLSNELAPFAYGVVGANPHLRLSADQAATARAIGVFSQGDHYNESAANGYNSVRADVLYNMSQAVPDSATIGQLVNRRLLSVQDANFWIQRGGYGNALHSPLLALREDVLSPADAALAVLRSEITPAAGAAKAALSGVTAEDFNTLVLNTGEPPGATELMEALRRKFIDIPRFTHGIQQSRVRNEWVDVYLALRYSPMSIADAVQGVVQNHLSAAEAAVIADANGLEPGQIGTLIENAGEPLSRTELEQLYNRGEIDLATVEQGLRESRLKNKYIADAVALHVRLPEPRQVVSMVGKGVLTDQQAAAYLLESGFSQETAALLIAEGTATKLGAHKDLTVGEIRTLYTDKVFTASQATDSLTVLGYTGTEAAFLIQSWDMIAFAAITRQAVGVIRSRFVSRRIDWPTAAADLTELGIPDAAISQYEQIWGVEQSATVAVVTEAQIVHFVKTNLLSQQDGHDRLTARGYTDDDANMLLGLAPGAALAQTIGGTSG